MSLGVDFRAYVHETGEILDVEKIDFYNFKVEVGYKENKVVGFNDCDLLQNTQVEDINGKDIYQGDIVSVTFREVLSPFVFSKSKVRKFSEVFYNDGSFVFKNQDLELCTVCSNNVKKYHLEVVGNIFNNTELLSNVE